MIVKVRIREEDRPKRMGRAIKTEIEMTLPEDSQTLFVLQKLNAHFGVKFFKVGAYRVEQKWGEVIVFPKENDA